MVDSATTRNRLRKQEEGTNVNSWGTNLNEAFDVIDQALDGVESINLGAASSYTLVTTNYTTADEAKQRVLRFTNAHASGSLAIVPSVEHQYTAQNNGSGAAVTVKTAAGTGVEIPNNRQCDVFSDGLNVYAGSANWISNYASTLANDGDIVVKVTMQSAIAVAIAAASISNTGQVLVSLLDTTSGYLSAKIVAGTGIDITDSGAGDATLTISVNTTELEEILAVTGKVTATLSGGTTAMTARRRYRISSTATGTLPTMGAGDFVIVEFTNGAGITATVGRNAQTIDGAAEDDTYVGAGSETPVIRYDYASAGVVTSRLIEGIP